MWGMAGGEVSALPISQPGSQSIRPTGSVRALCALAKCTLSFLQRECKKKMEEALLQLLFQLLPAVFTVVGTKREGPEVF